MNGSASRPSSATMNGTRCAIMPETNATSLDSPVELGNQHAAFGSSGRSEAAHSPHNNLAEIDVVSGTRITLRSTRPFICSQKNACLVAIRNVEDRELLSDVKRAALNGRNEKRQQPYR